MEFPVIALAEPRSLARCTLGLWLAATAVVITGSLLGPRLLADFQRIAGSPLSSNDKLNHFIAYTLLAALPVVSVQLASAGIMLAGCMIPFGVSLEFAQRLVPGRSFEIPDMLANTLGVCTGVLIALTFRWVSRAAVRATR